MTLITPNMNVLIVDDHKTMLRIIRNILSQVNISNVDEAYDGQDALRRLTQKRYDLVLSDWNMMPMTGLEFLQHVRTNPTYQHKHVPFIMITAESKRENMMEAIKAGVDHYILKPFDAETLEKTINVVLAKKRA